MYSSNQVLDPIWSYTFGNWGWDNGRAVIDCRSGGFLISGSTYDSSNENMEILLIRLDEDGNYLWDNTYGSGSNYYGREVVECSDGGFAVAGFYEISEDVRNALIIRVDENGMLLWQQTFGGNDDDMGWAIVECSSGGFAIAGYTQSFGILGQDVWLIRVDGEGNHLWTQTYGGTNNWEAGWALVECFDEGFAIAGYTRSYGAGSSDMYLIRTDADGNQLWQQTYGGVFRDWANGLVQYLDGGFVLCGQTESFGEGGLDIWLVKTDTNGAQIWNHTYGGSLDEYGREMVKCFDGGFAIVGYTESFGVGCEDICVVRTEANGEIKWCKTYGGYNDELGWGIDACINGDFIITGHTESYGSGYEDVYVLRIPDSSSDRTTSTTTQWTTYWWGFLYQQLIVIGLSGITIISCIAIYAYQRRQKRISGLEYSPLDSTEDKAPSDGQPQRGLETGATMGYCVRCGAAITSSQPICPICRAPLTRCMVCSRFISANEEWVNCPYCGASAHKDELLEWIKVKGYCPKCGHELDMDQFF